MFSSERIQIQGGFKKKKIYVKLTKDLSTWTEFNFLYPLSSCFL